MNNCIACNKPVLDEDYFMLKGRAMHKTCGVGICFWCGEPIKREEDRNGDIHKTYACSNNSWLDTCNPAGVAWGLFAFFCLAYAIYAIIANLLGWFFKT